MSLPPPNNGGCALRNWELQGANRAQGPFTVLRRHVNDSTIEAGPEHSMGAWSVRARGEGISWSEEKGYHGAFAREEKGYRFFRIVQFDWNSASSHSLCCSGIELYGTLWQRPPPKPDVAASTIQAAQRRHCRRRAAARRMELERLEISRAARVAMAEQEAREPRLPPMQPLVRPPTRQTRPKGQAAVVGDYFGTQQAAAAAVAVAAASPSLSAPPSQAGARRILGFSPQDGSSLTVPCPYCGLTISSSDPALRAAHLRTCTARDHSRGRGESFLRVHWVAVPKALRARRVNRRP
jgi:hypothetical protein